MIRIHDLHKSFIADDGTTVRALRGVNLTIHTGEFIALMGPNGSGKSTLLRCLLGATVDGGEIVWNASADSQNGTMKGILFVPQNPSSLSFPDMTLEEHLLIAERRDRRARFWRRGITRERRERYVQFLSRYGALNLAERLGQPLRSLSGGWQQAFVILLVVASIEFGAVKTSTRILLLDEPVANLDIANAERCIGLIRRLHRDGYTVLIATHDLSLAFNTSRRICILREGTIVADLPTEEARRQGITTVLELLQGQTLVG